MKKWPRKLMIFFIMVFTLMLLVLLLLNTRVMKRFIRDKLQAYLAQKTKTDFRIGNINYGLPKWVELDDVFIKDRSGDTLLAGAKIRIDINMLKLLKGKYEVSSIQLGKINISVTKKQNDSAFNFQFIIDAFAKSTQPEKTKDTSSFVLTLREIDIKDSRFNWKDDRSGLLIHAIVGRFNILIDTLDFKHQAYVINTAMLNNVQFDMKELNVLNKQTIDTSAAFFFPRIRMNAFTVNKSRLSFVNDLSNPLKRKSIDYAHPDLQDLAMKASGIEYTPKKMHAQIAQLTFHEKSGFVVDSLWGEASMDRDKIMISKARLVTTNSKLSANGVIYPLSINGKGDLNVANQVLLQQAVLSKKDLEFLFPGIAEKYRSQLSAINTLYIDMKAEGTAQRMEIRQLVLRSDKNKFVMNVNGHMQHPFDKNRLQYDLNIKELTAVKSMLDPWVNNKSNRHIDLPPSLTATGHVSGNMRIMNHDLAVKSRYGFAILKGNVSDFTKPQQLAYNIQVLANELETGKWIGKDSLLGKVTGIIYMKGKGINYKTADIISRINLKNFRVLQHRYTGILLNMNGHKGSFDLKGSVTDPLLLLNLEGKVSVAGKYPVIQSRISLQNADLEALGLYKDSLRIQTEAAIQLNNLDPAALDAAIRLNTTHIYRGTQHFYIDSLITKGYIDSGLTLLTLRSSLANADVKGKYAYNDLGNIFKNYVKKYTGDTGIVITKIPAAEEINIQATIKPNPVYAILLPGLFFDQNIHLKGKIETRNADTAVYVTASVPYLVYKTNAISGLNALVRGINDSLKLDMVLDTVRTGNIFLYQTSLSGGLSNRYVNASLVTDDEKGKEKYKLGIKGSKVNDVFEITLNDTLKLNYSNWQAGNKNLIRMGKGGVNVSQLDLANTGQRIYINSNGPALNAPMDLVIEKFRLSNISGILNKDSLFVNGILNMKVKADGLQNKIPTIDGTAAIDSLTYNNLPVGNLSLNARTSNNLVNFDGNLTGNGSNVEIKGIYDQRILDASINLNPLRAKAFEAFSKHNLSRSGGGIYGPVNIKGPLTQLSWNGTLKFDSVTTSLVKYGIVLKLDNQEISLAYPVISINKFTIRDSAGHPLVIYGSLTQQPENGFSADLSMTTRDFIVLNNSAIDNNELYGTAMVNADAIIKGPVTSPDITGNIKIGEKSQVTYVRQNNTDSRKEREGVIEFVKMDTIPDILVVHEVKQKRRIMPAALNYNLNIDIDSTAQLSIIIDPVKRDELIVKGGAQLNAGMNPNGQVVFTGAYNLTAGSYQLNYQFLKRKFELQEGSTLLFSGDPKEAEANITAIYEMEAEPLDLIGNEIESGGRDNSFYKQKLPFQVILKIKGTILQPKLGFDIKLKDKIAGISNTVSTTIENKLAQLRTDASAMSKQVFALLVMNRFISEQSRDFFAGGGSSSNQLVKASVSGFLAEAVNQVAADLIKGVDINVNLKSVDNYAAVTQRTDLNLALSKRFLDDRLNVTVGKNFTVEGEDPLAKTQNNSNLDFLPDITTNYKLSKDGKYMLRAYRRNQYEAILDGYFVETGVAFIISMDYIKFSEIFNQLKKKKNPNQDAEPR